MKNKIEHVKIRYNDEILLKIYKSQIALTKTKRGWQRMDLPSKYNEKTDFY